LRYGLRRVYEAQPDRLLRNLNDGVKPFGATLAKPQVFNPALVRAMCAAKVNVETIKLAPALMMDGSTPGVRTILDHGTPQLQHIQNAK
jgi:hypothetical protein